VFPVKGEDADDSATESDPPTPPKRKKLRTAEPSKRRRDNDHRGQGKDAKGFKKHKVEDVRCYRHQQLGHYARNCPAPKAERVDKKPAESPRITGSAATVDKLKPEPHAEAGNDRRT
jgi:hypothetical protein